MLLVGFGPFSTVVRNPAAQLALSLDGRRLGKVRVVGREIPVEYDGGPAETMRLIREIEPLAVSGMGVAVGRTVPMLERVGVRWADPHLQDNAGMKLGDLEPEGPETVHSTAAIRELAAAMGAEISEDAGRYVCNAWLYRMVRAIGARLPVTFLHVPAEGMPAENLARALVTVWGH